MSESKLYVGSSCSLDSSRRRGLVHLPAHHLVTHGVVLGMTGSGKTGLVTVMVEEALRNQIPVLVIDVKGDLPGLLLSFPGFDGRDHAPWLERASSSDVRSTLERANALAQQRQASLAQWGLHANDLDHYAASTHVRVITPGSTAGESLHLLSSLERRSDRWSTDEETARAALGSSVSFLLSRMGRDANPARSREHAVLYALAERRLTVGGTARVEMLIEDLKQPPIDRIASLDLDSFMGRNERRDLAAALNALLVSPGFSSWRQGEALNVQEWMTPKDGRTPAVVLSVAHLHQDDRMLVLGMVLEEVLTWVRSQPSSHELRAMVVFDELYGILPPHPQNPPTKRPLVALMQQARAFGVGVLLATQNTMDLDYRALSNAGLWCVGRLQTDADRKRVVSGLSTANGHMGMTKTALDNLLRQLGPRWFLMRDMHGSGGPLLMQPRQTMTLMRGPMSREEIRRAREVREERWRGELVAAEE